MSDRALQAQLPGGARALFTTRAQGNLSLSAGDGHEQGRARRDQLAHELGLRWLCASPQVHASDVQRIRAVSAGAGEPVREPADGHATALPKVGVMALAADCMPVAIAAGGAVAMVHAGWRGLAAGVLEEGVRAVRELGGAGPAAAVIGPAAGVCCYEVGPEGAFSQPGWRGWIASRRAPSAMSASSHTAAKAPPPGARVASHG